jgi:hypothetical protein
VPKFRHARSVHSGELPVSKIADRESGCSIFPRLNSPACRGTADEICSNGLEMSGASLGYKSTE